MKRLLFALTVTVALAQSQAAAAQCSYTASPTIALRLDGPLNAYTQQHEVVEHWTVGCTATCNDAASATKFWDGVRLYFASERGTELTGVNTLGAGSDPGVDHGDNAVDSPIAGVRVYPVFKAGCGTQVATSGLVSIEGAPVVVPPFLPPVDRINVFIDDRTFPGLPIVSGTVVPLNRQFHIRTDIVAQPKGNEAVVVNVVGAGIDFHKRYTGAGGSIGEQLAKDPEASFLATTPDTISMFLDFEGTHSTMESLTVVPYDADGNPMTGPSGDQDATSDPAAGQPSAPADEPDSSGGCAMAGSGLAAGIAPALWALVALARRRRR